MVVHVVALRALVGPEKGRGALGEEGALWQAPLWGAIGLWSSRGDKGTPARCGGIGRERSRVSVDGATG
jgi:hypothetical protein